MGLDIGTRVLIAGTCYTGSVVNGARNSAGEMTDCSVETDFTGTRDFAVAAGQRATYKAEKLLAGEFALADLDRQKREAAATGWGTAEECDAAAARLADDAETAHRKSRAGGYYYAIGG